MYAYADILFLIIGACCFSNFLDDCMEPGMVFAFWGAFIKKEVRLNEKTKAKNKHIPVPFWKKPLGACIFCINTWVIILFFTCFVLLKPMITLLGCIGIGNSFFKIILRFNL